MTRIFIPKNYVHDVMLPLHFNKGNLSVLRTPKIWTKHTNNECAVCIKQKRGGRPPKVRKHSGRPKAAITVEDLINFP